mgnify:CR=1 FL=1
MVEWEEYLAHEAIAWTQIAASHAGRHRSWEANDARTSHEVSDSTLLLLTFNRE